MTSFLIGTTTTEVRP